MKRLIVILCAAAGICPLWAQQSSAPAVPSAVPPSVSEVMHFYDVMHVRDQVTSRLAAQQKQIKIVIDDMFDKNMPDATAEQRKQMDALVDGMMSDIFKDYPVEGILRDMVPVYQNHLSAADLDAIVAFYSSPAGQKIVREMPTITSEAMRVSYARLQPRIEEMMKNIQTRVAAMKDGQGGGTSEPKP